MNGRVKAGAGREGCEDDLDDFERSAATPFWFFARGSAIVKGFRSALSRTSWRKGDGFAGGRSGAYRFEEGDNK